MFSCRTKLQYEEVVSVQIALFMIWGRSDVHLMFLLGLSMKSDLYKDCEYNFRFYLDCF